MYTEKHVRLLLECLKSDEAEISPGSLDGKDAKAILELADRQFVAPLLYRKVEGRSTPFPKNELKELRVLYHKYAARNMMLYSEFSGIFEMLHRQGIPFSVLKGVHLGEAIYGDPALRPVSDLDLLVKQADLVRTAEALQEFGYAQDQTSIPDRARHHLPHLLKAGAVPIELHWDISAYRMKPLDDIETLWSRAKWEYISGVNVLVLSTEDLLLHLSLHAARHNFTVKLISIYDIRQILHRRFEEIRWDQLLTVTRRWSAGRALYLTLRISRDMLGAAVPPSVLRALEPPDFDERYIAFAKLQIFAEKKLISESLARMWSSGRTRERLGTIYRRFFPGTEFMHAEYGSSKKSGWIYFYYFVRFFALFRRYGPTLCRMAFKSREGLLLPDAAAGYALRDWLLG